jgi:NitT/TauT family transport system substrate-binding protein
VTLSRARMLGLLGAAVAAAPARVIAQSGPVIRVGVEDAETYGEPLYGIDAGIFARAGLNVEATILPAAGTIAAALAGGALDVGLTDAIVLANAVNRGVPIVAIAASGLFRTTDPTSGLCVPKNSALRTAKSFEGGSIAVGTLVSLTSVSLKMWLARNGANPAGVRFVEMPFNDMPAALARGTVSGAYVTEPLLTRNAADLQLIATPYGAIAESFPISLIAAGRAWLAQNPEPARRFVAALYETARWANANREVTAPMLARHSKIELEVIRRMRRTLFATSLDAGMVQPVLDAAFANKLIDRQTNAADLIARV